MKRQIIFKIIIALTIAATVYFAYQTIPPSPTTGESNVTQNTQSQKEEKQPLEVSCQTNSDCRVLISPNDCSTYCVNNEHTNNETIPEIKISCDPTLWDPLLERNCACIDSQCQFTE